MTAPNELIAQPVDEAPGTWDGLGVASSWDAVGDAAQEGDALGTGFAVAGAGLATLDTVMNPLDSLGTAGVGWLVEHIGFLQEPLDMLAGSPADITAQAQTWHNVSAQLTEVAGQYRDAADAVGAAWEGAASAAYAGVVADYTARLDEAAAMAERLASVILTSGAGVGTVRALIEGWIVDFLWEVVKAVVLWGLLAFLTLGGGLAAGAVQVILRAIDLASDIARRISQLLDALSDAGRTAGQLVDAMRDVAGRARGAAPTLRAAGQDVLDAADGGHADTIIETGSQLTEARRAKAGWTDPPTP